MTEDRIGKEISGSMHRRFPSRKEDPSNTDGSSFQIAVSGRSSAKCSLPVRSGCQCRYRCPRTRCRGRTGAFGGYALQQNGGAVVEELVVRILGVGDDGTLGVEAESHLIVLEAAVHGVDPGGAVGQHAGFPAGNSTACQVQLAITASAVTSAAMCRNFFCSGLGPFAVSRA